MLAKFFNGLWIVKAEPKSLEAFLGVVKSLGMSWGSKSKPFICSSLKSVSKNWQDEMCYTFDVTGCDRIIYYLLLEKQIKLPSGHVILLQEQLKKHVYCKEHNSYSHATNELQYFPSIGSIDHK
jgi:hypothetical protein